MKNIRSSGKRPHLASLAPCELKSPCNSSSDGNNFSFSSLLLRFTASAVSLGTEMRSECITWLSINFFLYGPESPLSDMESDVFHQNTLFTKIR